MVTMRKSTHGFLFVSHMSMGICLAALRAARVPLKPYFLPFLTFWMVVQAFFFSGIHAVRNIAIIFSEKFSLSFSGSIVAT